MFLRVFLGVFLSVSLSLYWVFAREPVVISPLVYYKTQEVWLEGKRTEIPSLISYKIQEVRLGSKRIMGTKAAGEPFQPPSTYFPNFGE